MIRTKFYQPCEKFKNFAGMSNALLRDAHRSVAGDVITSLEVGDGFAVVAGWASQPRG